jgi:hypothetical protein
MARYLCEGKERLYILLKVFVRSYNSKHILFNGSEVLLFIRFFKYLAYVALKVCVICKGKSEKKCGKKQSRPIASIIPEFVISSILSIPVSPVQVFSSIDFSNSQFLFVPWNVKLLLTCT